MSVLRNLESPASKALSKGSSTVPSARASSRSRSPGSWPRRWTPTRPPRSPASTSPTSTPCTSRADDHERMQGYESSLEQELSGHLLEHARRHDYDLMTRPVVEFDKDDRLRLGEFGIQTRLVKPPPREGAEATQGDQGHTMVYSAPAEGEPLREAPARRALVETKAIVALDDRRYVLDGPTRDPRALEGCECVIRTPTSPGGTRSCGETAPATGRSSTSARPTASRSTAAASTPAPVARRRSHPRNDDLHLRYRAVSDTRADRGRAQVRLHRRALPLPAVDCPHRAARPARQARPRPSRRPATTTSVGGGPAPREDASLVVVEAGRPEERRALRPLRRALDRPLARRRHSPR